MNKRAREEDTEVNEISYGALFEKVFDQYKGTDCSCFSSDHAQILIFRKFVFEMENMISRKQALLLKRQKLYDEKIRHISAMKELGQVFYLCCKCGEEKAENEMMTSSCCKTISCKNCILKTYQMAVQSLANGDFNHNPSICDCDKQEKEDPDDISTPVHGTAWDPEQQELDITEEQN